MKRFIFSALAVTVFCVGLGSLAERAGASFKSDEKALAIIRDARQAIGGDTALAAVRSMVINGQMARTIKVDGVDRTMQGESEIAMQLPDKLVKRLEFKHGDGTGPDKVEKHVNVVIVGDKGKGEGNGAGTGVGEKHIVITKDGATQELTGADAEKFEREHAGDAQQSNVVILRKTDDGNAKFVTRDDDHVMLRRTGGPEHEVMKQNELLRLTLSLLLTAPQGMDVSYTFAGETDVDGTACNIVVAETAGSSFKLFIGKSSNLPVMLSYKGVTMPDVVMFRTKSPEVGEAKDNIIFTRKVEGPPMETAEYNVKFSDFRSVNGVQLPFKWTQTAGDATVELFTVAAYDINPANIADKFANENMKVKVRAPDVQ